MLNERLFKIVTAIVAVVGFVMLMVFAVNAGNDASYGNLEQGTWKLTTLVLDGTETAAIEGSDVTIAFDDGRIEGSGGCNSYQGEYRTDGPILAVENVASTAMFCDDPAGVSDQEVAFLGLLTSADEFLIDDDQLILSGGDTRLMLLTR